MCQQMKPWIVYRSIIFHIIWNLERLLKSINQILLFQDGKNSTLEISNIDYFFNQKIKQYKALSKEQDKQVIKEQVKDIYGSIREKIISQIMIRRTRTDLMNIEQYKKNLDDAIKKVELILKE